MSNKTRTVFYIGVTSYLESRIIEHRKGLNDGFTRKYNCKYFVYYEHYDEITQAIAREKQLKNWHRQWKINLIKTKNPTMRDLSFDFIDPQEMGF